MTDQPIGPPAEAGPAPAPKLKPSMMPPLDHIAPYVLVLAALAVSVWLQDKGLVEKYLDLIIGAGLLAINPKGRGQ